MTPLGRLSRSNLSEQVAGKLLEMLSGQGWKAGDKLPPEPDLCKQLGVGRSTLREGLKSLAFLGVVRSRAGEGTFVAGDTERLLDGMLLGGLLRSRKEITDLCEARLVLETELAALCAMRATNDELEQLRGLASRMVEDEGLTTKEFVEFDLAFHLGVAAASKNEILTQLLKATRGLLQEWIIRSQTKSPARRLAKTGHEEILRAIESRNPEAARAAMASHLRGSFELLEAATAEGAAG